MNATILWPLRPWIGKFPSSLQRRFDPGLWRATRPAWGGCLAGVRCEDSGRRMDDGDGRLGRGKAGIIPGAVHMESKKKKISSSLGTFGNRACVHVPAARGRFLAEIESIREEANPDPVQFESPLAIVMYPDPRLRLKNKRINVFDENLRQLVDEMFDVMYRTDGVGLSAPQVGVNVQLMVYNPIGVKGEGEEYVLINPKIVKYARSRAVVTEGCLSFPHIDAAVERPVSVRVEAQDIKGKKFSINLKEWQARIFQHEYDHLEGVLYIDRMNEEVVKTILPELMKLEEDFEKRTGQPAPERIHDRKFSSSPSILPKILE